MHLHPRVDAQGRRAERRAHAVEKHVAERLEEQHLTKIPVAIIAGGFANTPGQYVGVTALLCVGSGLTFSRAQESEADRCPRLSAHTGRRSRRDDALARCT